MRLAYTSIQKIHGNYIYSRKGLWNISNYLIQSNSVSRICHETIFSRMIQKERFFKE